MITKQGLTGKVLWFDDRDGNGIIQTDDGQQFYTDISAIVSRLPLKYNTRVQFNVNSLITDCLCACDVVTI